MHTSTELLSNHLGGRWTAGTGTATPLFDPVLGTELVRVTLDRQLAHQLRITSENAYEFTQHPRSKFR
ncbi:hypothetical protein [Sphaerotilus sp.]|uniref:hypothetical protein n=1 Tax=Sphaerotilus sp. TaxID=2093942 RepID=UPI00286E408F|nr:hypothetical protein [Sphaerotilus sp.]